MEKKVGKSFGYVQFDFEVPGKLTKTNFAKFRSNLNNNLVSHDDIGGLMKKYAEDEWIFCQPWKVLILSLMIQNGTLINSFITC